MGRAGRAARSSRADLGIARGRPGPGWWLARLCADVGIAAPAGSGTGAGCGRSDLGRSGARGLPTAGSLSACRCSVVWWPGCTCPVMGRAPAGVRASSCVRASGVGCAACSSGTRRRPAAGASPSLGRACRLTAIMGGFGGRFAAVTHPDRTVVESPGAGLDSSTARCPRFGSARIHRLGRAAARVRCATADRRTRVERSGVRVVGCAEDRGARGSRGAVVVGAILCAQRTASWGPGSVELACAGCSNSPGTMVAARA
jgi:hypothetical protein